MEAAKVNVRIANHWLRISRSVYNTMADIERLLAGRVSADGTAFVFDENADTKWERAMARRTILL